MAGNGERNLLLTLRFDGSAFHGSAIQKNAPTVQGALQQALCRVFGEAPDVKCASRTDAGVHARAFCVSFHTKSAVPCERLIEALNAYLPPAAAVYGCREVPPDFHARYSCHGKRYRYQILNSRIRDPFLLSTAFRVPYRLDWERMDKAAKAFLGTHDFSAFCSAGGSVQDRRRTIFLSHVWQEGELVLFETAGDGFLYNMVRIMAGTLIEVGAGKRTPESILQALQEGERRLAGFTAPAGGLCLEQVYYDGLPAFTDGKQEKNGKDDR